MADLAVSKYCLGLIILEVFSNLKDSMNLLMNAISCAKTYKTNRETSEESEWLWLLTSAVFVVYYVMCLTLPHCLGAAGWLRRNLWMEQKLLLSLEATEPGHGKCHGSRGAKGVLGYPSFQAAVWIIRLSCTLCYQCCSWYHLLSYLSLLFPKNFSYLNPWSLNLGLFSPLHPASVGRRMGQGKGKWASSAWFAVFWWEY